MKEEEEEEEEDLEQEEEEEEEEEEEDFPKEIMPLLVNPGGNYTPSPPFEKMCFEEFNKVLSKFQILIMMEFTTHLKFPGQPQRTLRS